MKRKALKEFFAQTKKHHRYRENARTDWSVGVRRGVLGRLQEPHHQHFCVANEQHATDDLNPRGGKSPRPGLHWDQSKLSGSAIKIQLGRVLNFSLPKHSFHYRSRWRMTRPRLLSHFAWDFTSIHRLISHNIISKNIQISSLSKS